jgi:hypothetical protein
MVFYVKYVFVLLPFLTVAQNEVFFRADRQEMLLKTTRSDDVELKATLIDKEQKVDLHVPESPGKS